MSSHKTFFDEVTNPGLTESFFGDPGVYTPITGGDPVPGYFVLSTDVVIEPIGYDSTTVTVGDTIEALVSDVGDMSEGDTIVFDAALAVTYTAKKELENNGSITKWVVNDE